MMNYEFFEIDDKSPIYYQIVQLIKKTIVIGELKPGEKLPSVREMSSILGVNQNTLQRAYSELESLGITVTKRGLGSYVVDDEDKIEKLRIDMGTEMVEKFIKDISSINMSIESAIKLLRGSEG